MSSGKKDKKSKLLKKTNPNDEWVCGTLLGKGTFGSVYVATSVKGGPSRAAKICTIEDQDVFEDTKLEVEILSTCDHQNILRAFDSFYWERKIWMILEFCAGGALDEITDNLEGLDEVQTKTILFQCLQGLAYLHSKGILHRDIKAGNIMLTENGICKLADFGVSAIMPSPDAFRNTFIGTPYWMAPEVILTETQPHMKYNAKCDVYSLGITAIELVQIQPPDDDIAPVQVMVFRIKMESPTLENPGAWSKAFNDFVNASLEKNPNKRPTSEQCLKMDFFQGDIIKNNECLVEVYNIYRAMNQGAVNEEDVSDEDGREDISGFDLDISTTISPSGASHPSKESVTSTPPSLTPSSSEKNLSTAEKSLVVEKPPERKSSSRTIRKTIKYEVNGVSKMKTITKNVNADNKDKKDLFKSMRDKIVHQLRALKLEETREQNKLDQNHKTDLANLQSKQRNEYDSFLDKYKGEADTFQRNISRDVERKKIQLRNDIEKMIKKNKSTIDKERKNVQAAQKGKNKSKVDSSILDPNYISNKQAALVESTVNFIEAQNKILCEYYVDLVNEKNKALTETLKSLISTRLLQVLEVSQVQRNHICNKLEAILQTRIKSNQKEISVTMKCMSAKREEKVREQQRVRRELPKMHKMILKKELEAYKASLRKSKVKNERELLGKKQQEVLEKLDAEVQALQEKHQKELQDYDQLHEAELRDIQDYQDQKNELTIRAYQEFLHSRYQQDELDFKVELVKMYNMKKSREQDYETEMKLALCSMIEGFPQITFDIY